MLPLRAKPCRPVQARPAHTYNVQAQLAQHDTLSTISPPAYHPQLHPSVHPRQSRPLSHLTAPFVRHRWIQNPHSDTWFTEGECTLICAILIHIRKPGTPIPKHPYIHPYTYTMLSEILQMIRNALPVPWKYLALNCYQLHMYIRDHPDNSIKRLWHTARHINSDFWRGRARWAFDLWAITDSPLAQQLWHSRELPTYYPKAISRRFHICTRLFNGPYIPTVEHPANIFTAPMIHQHMEEPVSANAVNTPELSDRSLQIRRQIDELLGRKIAVG